MGSERRSPASALAVHQGLALPEPSSHQVLPLGVGPTRLVWGGLVRFDAGKHRQRSVQVDRRTGMDDVRTEVEDHLLGVIPYRGYYVMLYEYGWYSMSGTAGPYGSYCADVRLAVSRDGEHYTRVLPDQKVISRGRFGEWDDGFLIVSDKVAIKDDTMYLYYCGHDRNYPGFAGDMLHPPSLGYPKTDVGTKRVSQMGLATLPLDRFTCLKTDDGEVPGFAVTTPIALTDPGRTRLILNVSDTIPARSWVDVEVLDADTLETLAGFSRSDCNGVDRDGLDMLVSWGDDRTLSGVEVPRIALRFWIYGAARLYSFAFGTT